jgi:hypothetical protein
MHKKIILLLSIAWLLANNTQAQQWSIVYEYTAKQNPLIFKHEQSFVSQLHKKVMEQDLIGYKQFEWGKDKSPRQPYAPLELKKQYVFPPMGENLESEKNESYFFPSQMGLAIGFNVHETKGLTSLNAFETFIPAEYTSYGISKPTGFYSFKEVQKSLGKSFSHQWTPPLNHQQTLSWQEALQQRALIPNVIRIFYGREEIAGFSISEYQSGVQIDTMNKVIPIPDYVTQWIKWESQVSVQEQGSKRISTTNTYYNVNEQHNALLEASLSKIMEGIVSGKLTAYTYFNTETNQFEEPLDTASLVKRVPLPLSLSLDFNNSATQATYRRDFDWSVERQITSGESIQKKPLAYNITIYNHDSGLSFYLATFKPNELIDFLKNEGHEKAATYIAQDYYTGCRQFVMSDLFGNEYYSGDTPTIFEMTEEEMKTVSQWFIDDVRKVLQEIK